MMAGMFSLSSSNIGSGSRFFPGFTHQEMFVFGSSSCKLILEEQILQNPREVEGENEMNECRKLQVNNVLEQN